MTDSTEITADEGVEDVKEETEEVVPTISEKEIEPEKETAEEETPGEVAGAPAPVVSEDATEEPLVEAPAEESPPPSDPRLAMAAPTQSEDSAVEEKKETEAIAAIPRKGRPAAVDTAIAASASLDATVSHDETPTPTDSVAPAVSFHDSSVLTSRPGRPGPIFGLKQGVHVPNSIDSSLLEGRILDSLNELPVSLVNDALIEYDDAINNKGGQIRSRGAYLMGVIKRYVSVHERAGQAGEGSLPMGHTLTPVVQERLDKLVLDGFCTQEEMNDKVKSKIRMLSEKDALFAIEELAGVDRGQIRNFSSYFMGILNRYMRGERESKHNRAGTSNDRRGKDDHRRDSDRHRGDRHRGRSPDRDSYQDRGPRYGDDRKFDSYRRDRSRDRHEDDRRRSDRPYDPRQNQPQQQQAQAQAPFMQQQQQPQQMYPGAFQSGLPSGVPGPGMQGMSLFPQQQQQAQQQQFMMNPSFQQPQQQQGMQQYSPQSAPAFANQLTSSPGTFMSNITSAPGPSAMQQPSSMPQQQSQFMQMPSQQTQMQLPAGWPQQPQNAPGTLPPADILGLAEKAAAALQGVPMLSNPPQQQQPMMFQTQPQSSYGMPGMTTGSFQLQAPAPMPSQPPRSRGRSSAQLHELPITVQYAVQNLQATGHVDGQLDDGILGMIKELPEATALQALQKFASIDTQTMRSKNAYLTGVLRRELEAINRR